MVAVVIPAMVVCARTLRGRKFRRFEDQSEKLITQRFPLPPLVLSSAEVRRASFAPFVQTAHEAATAAQTRYYMAVVGSTCCLMLGFVALAFGSLHLQDEYPVAALILNWIDVLAISTVVILYYCGRNANSRWIGVRVRVELLRQYQYLNTVFPNVISPAPNAPADTQFAGESVRTEDDVERGPVAEIVTRIEQFWSARRAAIAMHALTEVDCTRDSLVLYLQRRVRRQLGWFTDSKARLESTAAFRDRVLPVLYWTTLALVLLKVMSFLQPEWFDSVLTPLLGRYWQSYLLSVALITTGASAAMTAYYINQNTRSLIHRYYSQQRFIERWLKDFNERWNFAGLPAQEFTHEAKDAIRAEILRFEDLMIEEMIDWTHITTHDAIELAP
jgi:hypothetical protein